MDPTENMRRYFESDGSPIVNDDAPTGLINVGDGHRYDEIWDNKGRRWVCQNCGAHLFRDRIACTRKR